MQRGARRERDKERERARKEDTQRGARRERARRAQQRGFTPQATDLET
jgi:hypothetical protein